VLEVTRLVLRPACSMHHGREAEGAGRAPGAPLSHCRLLWRLGARPSTVYRTRQFVAPEHERRRYANPQKGKVTSHM